MNYIDKKFMGVFVFFCVVLYVIFYCLEWDIGCIEDWDYYFEIFIGFIDVVVFFRLMIRCRYNV